MRPAHVLAALALLLLAAVLTLLVWSQREGDGQPVAGVPATARLEPAGPGPATEPELAAPSPAEARSSAQEEPPPPPEPPQPAGPVDLRVQVLDVLPPPRPGRRASDGSRPLEGALVRLTPVAAGGSGIAEAQAGSEARTDATGTAVLLQVEPPRQRLVVSMPGFLEWERTLDLSRASPLVALSNGKATMRIGLRRWAGRVRGLALDGDGGAVEGAAVVLVESPSGASQRFQRRGSRQQGGGLAVPGPFASTDAAGGFALDLPGGVEEPALLVCPRRDELPALVVVRVPPEARDGQVPVVVALGPAYEVDLEVVTAQGRAARGALLLERDGVLLDPAAEPLLTGIPGLERPQGLDPTPGRLRTRLLEAHYVLHFRPWERVLARGLFALQVDASTPRQRTFQLER